MKKAILGLPLILIINNALAGHVGFSSDENLLIYIPVSLLIIWWLSKIIRKNYLIYKSQLADKVREKEGVSTNLNDQIDKGKEIPEYYKEKDVFGFDKP
jgi:hypothetical protein